MIYSIYLIKSKNTDKIYIGCTSKKIKTRYSHHKSAYKRYNNIDTVSPLYCSSYEILKMGNCECTLYEKYFLDSKEKRSKKEAEIIALFGAKCINKIKILKKPPSYYRGRYYEKARKQITCDNCGAMISTRNISTHKKKTKYCLNYNKKILN